MIYHRKLSAEDTLLLIIDEVTTALEELQADQNENGGNPTNQYVDGAKSAFVSCLEYLKYWEKAEEYGLDFDIEEIFPV